MRIDRGKRPALISPYMKVCPCRSSAARGPATAALPAFQPSPCRSVGGRIGGGAKVDRSQQLANRVETAAARHFAEAGEGKRSNRDPTGLHQVEAASAGRRTAFVAFQDGLSGPAPA